MENDNFNVKNPTGENIEYVFEKLLFNLMASCVCDEYKDSRKILEKLLQNINSYLYIYVNKRNLREIDYDELFSTHLQLISLKDKYFMGDNWYIERVDHWYSCLMLLRKYQIERE